MLFLKRTLPLLICLVTGLVFAGQYYVPHRASQELLTEVNDWMLIISGFALFLGIGSLFMQHLETIRRLAPGWGYSVVMFAGFVAMVATGVLSRGKSLVEETGSLTPFGWMYDAAMVPLSGTMFALLGFFIASAAFRAFRFKGLDSTLLLLAALIVMFGRVPLGEHLWTKGAAFLPDGFPQVGQVVEWIMGNLNLAAKRGIMLGVALGVIATSLKMIFGIERSYLGGRE